MSAAEKSVPFIYFNNIPDVDGHRNLVFCLIMQGWWDFKPIIADRLYEGMALGLIRFVSAVILAVTPAFNVDAKLVLIVTMVINIKRMVQVMKDYTCWSC